MCVYFLDACKATEAIAGIDPTAAAIMGAKKGKKPPLMCLRLVFLQRRIRRRGVALWALGTLMR